MIQESFLFQKIKDYYQKKGYVENDQIRMRYILTLGETEIIFYPQDLDKIQYIEDYIICDNFSLDNILSETIKPYGVKGDFADAEIIHKYLENRKNKYDIIKKEIHKDLLPIIEEIVRYNRGYFESQENFKFLFTTIMGSFGIMKSFTF